MKLYTIEEVNAHKFYKLPKQLFDNICYRKTLTSNAKLVYAILLDRMELSRKNNWYNENGEIFLLYTKSDIADMLDISETTAYETFKLLENAELIKQVEQDLNEPNKIFIAKINPVFKQNCEICTLKTEECESQYINNKTDDLISLSRYNTYFKIYNDYFIKKFGYNHMAVSAEQLERINKAFGEMREFDVDDKEFSEAVADYFEYLPDNNNGNILDFLKSCKRYFDVDLDNT